MARIKSKDTRPELVLRKALYARGLRYRLRGRGLPGRPDLVFAKYNVVVFVHGCCWHRHSDCKVASVPKSNVEFWADKFQKNVARDARAVQSLTELGWRVLVIWECELGSQKRVGATADRIAELIRDSNGASHEDGGSN